MVRPALRGVVTIGIASLIANQGVKRCVPRDRPPRELVPTARRAPAKDSSSFPSGHTASAVAFAIVLSRNRPRLTAPLAIMATAVGFSRVLTGVIRGCIRTVDFPQCPDH